MKLDSVIRLNVENEIQADPDIRSDDIALEAKDDIVTLAGFVHSYRQNLQAEAAAKRIAGVLDCWPQQGSERNNQFH